MYRKHMKSTQSNLHKTFHFDPAHSNSPFRRSSNKKIHNNRHLSLPKIIITATSSQTGFHSPVKIPHVILTPPAAGAGNNSSLAVHYQNDFPLQDRT